MAPVDIIELMTELIGLMKLWKHRLVCTVYDTKGIFGLDNPTFTKLVRTALGTLYYHGETVVGADDIVRRMQIEQGAPKIWHFQGTEGLNNLRREWARDIMN